MEYNDKKPNNIYIKHTKILLRQLLKSGDSMHMSDSKKSLHKTITTVLKITPQRVNTFTNNSRE